MEMPTVAAEGRDRSGRAPRSLRGCPDVPSPGGRRRERTPRRIRTPTGRRARRRGACDRRPTGDADRDGSAEPRERLRGGSGTRGSVDRRVERGNRRGDRQPGDEREQAERRDRDGELEPEERDDEGEGAAEEPRSSLRGGRSPAMSPPTRLPAAKHAIATPPSSRAPCSSAKRRHRQLDGAERDTGSVA